MFDLAKFNIKEVSQNETYGKYEIEPLQSGYGITLGNMLRRILLSSVPGAAVTAVKVDGVKHEYSSLDGVSDDILKIILKLKELAVVSKSDEPQTLKLNFKGKGVVKASDIELTSDVEIFNKELEITELSDAKAKLSMEIIVEKGTGYKLPDEDKRRQIGVIPVDSNFNPVKRVSTSIVGTRVGQETNLDKIVLDIYTNGSVKPWDALVESVKIMQSISNRMAAALSGDLTEETKEEQASPESEQKVTELSLDKLNLSTRLYNALKRANYKDLADLAGMSRREIYEIKGMGEKSANELFDLMKNYKIEVKED